MAKKKTTKKTTRKKAPAKKAASRAPVKKTSKKTTAKKATAKRTAAKKPAAKKSTVKKKASTKKKVKKKASTKKTTKKKASTKKTVKKASTKKSTAKKVVKKPTTKKTAAKTTKKAPAKKTTTKKAPAKGSKKKTTGRRRSAGARSVAEAASAGTADARGYVFVNGRRVRMISTGGVGVTKKMSSRRSAEEEPAAELSAKPIKTKLTTKELNHYKRLLLAKRAELIGDVHAMENAALQAGGGNLSNLPIHMADIGSDTYEQDFTLGLAETERARLREIEDALKRIKERTYGVCQMTGEQIPAARLDAKPWAKYTIEAARKLEGQWRPG